MTMLRQGHFEARRLISGVRPPVLDESGVVEAIAHLVHEESRLKEPEIEFYSKVSFDRLVLILENTIYRIVQEALTNARKHSQSRRVRISLLQRDKTVRIEVRDWGVGFDPNTVQEDHFGLASIRERARLLGGKYRIQSKAGEGTSIIVDLPVVERDEDDQESNRHGTSTPSGP
jgi:signal transduction histidine kinase